MTSTATSSARRGWRHGARRASRPALRWTGLGWWFVAAVILVLGAGTALVVALDVSAWRREVDLEVYRAAGVSLLDGRSLYGYLTDVPNLLPFTYPPFAAILAMPLALMPFGAAQLVWDVAQIAMLTGVCLLAGRPLLARCGPAAPVALATLIAGACWTLPVLDALFFGQVGVLLTLLCLLDVRAVARGRSRWAPGVLIGVAAAIKLTPAVFVVFLLLARRWRAAATAAGTAVGLTVGAALLFPQASVAYWGGALFDATRIGDTGSTYNGSFFGLAARLGPSGVGGVLLWGLVGAAVTAYGLWLGVTLLRQGADIAAASVVGFLTVLLSPIAWLHHLVWFVPAMLVLADDARSRVRVGLAAAAWFVIDAPLEFPWRGARWLYSGGEPVAVARLAQNSFPLLVLLLLLAIHAALVPPSAARRPRLHLGSPHRDQGILASPSPGQPDRAAVMAEPPSPVPHDQAARR